MVAFGGAGGLHAHQIAQSVGIDRVLVPPFAGVACAFGATTMDIRHDLEATFYAAADEIDVEALNGAYDDLEAEMVELLARDGVDRAAVTLERHALMRYIGQSYDVATPVPSGRLDSAAIADVKGEFHRAHEREYGVFSESFGIAFVTLRITGVGRTEALEVDAFRDAVRASVDGNGADPRSVKGYRQAYFNGEHHDVEVHDVARLTVGQVVRGPALIEQQDGVIVLPPGAVGRADDYENVLITTEEVMA